MGCSTLAVWADLKEHMVKHFVNVQSFMIWEALAPERAHAQWIYVWCVFALLQTYRIDLLK